MKILFIDDIRFPTRWHNIGENANNITVARSYKEAIDCLDNTYDIVSFDHDLGEEKTGYDIAKYMIENGIRVNIGIVVHTANPVGAFNIIQLMTHYGYTIIK